MRWSSAALLVAVTGWLAVSHARHDAARDDRSIVAVVGEDDKALGARLFEGPAGLAIRLDDAQRTSLQAIIRAYPLNGMAIALAALDREARGDRAAAGALTDQALRTEPRTRLAWLARLDRQMRARQTLPATISALRLLTVDPQKYPAYLPVLAALARDRRALPPIAAAMKEGPIWRTPFLALLGQDKFDPAIRYTLMNPDGSSDTAAAGDHAALIGDLVNRGDVERAYLAWISFLPDSALSGVGTPYDGRFAGLPGPPPFNWQLSAADGERATIGGGELEVSYSGRTAVTLASQAVLLPAGSYQLATVVRGGNSEGAAGGGTTLSWKVTCLPNYAALTELAIDPAVTNKPQQSPVFTVPAANCAAVNLALIGQAAEFPVRTNARLGSIVIQRAAAGASAPMSTATPTAIPGPNLP